MNKDVAMHIEDAETILIRWIREKPPTTYSNYGYDIYIPNVIRSHLSPSRGVNLSVRDDSNIEKQTHDLSPTFYAAA